MPGGDVMSDRTVSDLKTKQPDGIQAEYSFLILCG